MRSRYILHYFRLVYALSRWELMYYLRPVGRHGFLCCGSVLGIGSKHVHGLWFGQLPIKHGVNELLELLRGKLLRSCSVFFLHGQLPGGLLPNHGVVGLHELRRGLLSGLDGCVELRDLPCRNLLCDYWPTCRHMCCRHLLFCNGDRVLELRV